MAGAGPAMARAAVPGSTGATSSGSSWYESLAGGRMTAVPVPVAVAGSEMVMLACPMATVSVVVEVTVMFTAEGMVNVPL